MAKGLRLSLIKAGSLWPREWRYPPLELLWQVAARVTADQRSTALCYSRSAALTFAKLLTACQGFTERFKPKLSKINHDIVSAR